MATIKEKKKHKKKHISVKLLSIYLQWDSNKGQFSLFPLYANGNLPQQWNHMTNNNKNTSFVEANLTNISAKFQLYSPYGFWRDDFLFFWKFNLSVAMATNQIQRFGQK